jgi:hypothetical protein
MLKNSRFTQALVGVVAAAMMAGCGSAVPASQPGASAPFSAASKAARAVAFLSDWDNDVVYAIDSQGNVTTMAAVGGPEGLAVDAKHNLYVANEAYSEVLVYAPPYNSSPKVLSNAGVRPTGVAIDKDGDVAVTSTGSATSGMGGVTFYAKGATAPTKVIAANSKFAGDFYCAFDAHGNLYLDSENGSGPFEAGEVVGGINGKSVTPLTTENLVQYPGGVQVTRGGEIAILDQSANGSTATIYTYNPPKHGSLGSPVQTTSLASSNDAVAFALTNRTNQVLTGDTYFTLDKPRSNHQDQIGQAQWFGYPSGGGALKAIRLNYNATIVGAAVNPAESP